MLNGTNQHRALRPNQVVSKTGFSKSHLYRLIQAGQFPLPTKLSERIVVWDEAIIDDWLANKFRQQTAQKSAG
jgi:prophage regulatory protein